MKRALDIARFGLGNVSPNPMVGCVVAKGDRIIAEGWHRRFGGPHAEVDALRKCTKSASGATVHVSLEPCSHHGKTPPCTDALIAAGVKRVVIAVRDPNPTVSGRGVAQLRRAGIHVDVGLCAQEARDVLAPLLTRHLLGRPYVIAKWAQSLDGKLATRTGDSKWISCGESRRTVHKLRARIDAIMIGSETALQDDPLLTARDVPLRRTATRVVLDGRLRTRLRSALVRTASDWPLIVFTTKANASSDKAHQLRARGVEIVPARTRGGRIVVSNVLKQLAERDATNVLVEGGATLLRAFFQAGLIDESWVFVAPKLIGGDRDVGSVVTGVSRVSQARTPLRVHTRPSGVDTFYRMRWTDPPGASKY